MTEKIIVVAWLIIGLALFPAGTSSAEEYDLSRTLSDQAQETTIAFDGLAFVTGRLCMDSFLPPGKIADFFGFQYLRDTDPGGDGHSNEFLSVIANNVLYILTEDQVNSIIALAQSQVDRINAYAYDRFPLMKAFRRLAEGDGPDGATLSQSAVMDYSADLYEIDGRISFERAQLLGGIIRSLTTDQVSYLDELAKVGWADWPDVGDQVDKTSLPHDVHTAVMTYASQLFSWYAGSVEADVYFCPERQGTYFGSFFLKDAPLFTNPGYTIDPNLTADSGRNFLAALPDAQSDSIENLVNEQRDDLNGIVDVREQISQELRRHLTEEISDDSRVISLARSYGGLDGRIVHRYTTVFASIYQQQGAAGRAELTDLRGEQDYPCEGAYLYSDPIVMPDIEDTDFLFE